MAGFDRHWGRVGVPGRVNQGTGVETPGPLQGAMGSATGTPPSAALKPSEEFQNSGKQVSR